MADSAFTKGNRIHSLAQPPSLATKMIEIRGYRPFYFIDNLK
jgi:hypothetical protein